MERIQQILICCQKDAISCYIFGFLLVAKNFKLQSLLLSVLVGWLLVAKIPPHVMIGFSLSTYLQGGIFITSKWNFGHQEDMSMYLYIDLCKYGIGSHEDNKSEAK